MQGCPITIRGKRWTEILDRSRLAAVQVRPPLHRHILVEKARGVTDPRGFRVYERSVRSHPSESLRPSPFPYNPELSTHGVKSVMEIRNYSAPKTR